MILLNWYCHSSYHTAKNWLCSVRAHYIIIICISLTTRTCQSSEQTTVDWPTAYETKKLQSQMEKIQTVLPSLLFDQTIAKLCSTIQSYDAELPLITSSTRVSVTADEVITEIHPLCRQPEHAPNGSGNSNNTFLPFRPHMKKYSYRYKESTITLGFKSQLSRTCFLPEPDQLLETAWQPYPKWKEFESITQDLHGKRAALMTVHERCCTLQLNEEKEQAIQALHLPPRAEQIFKIFVLQQYNQANIMQQTGLKQSEATLDNLVYMTLLKECMPLLESYVTQKMQYENQPSFIEALVRNSYLGFLGNMALQASCEHVPYVSHFFNTPINVYATVYTLAHYRWPLNLDTWSAVPKVGIRGMVGELKVELPAYNVSVSGQLKKASDKQSPIFVGRIQKKVHKNLTLHTTYTTQLHEGFKGTVFVGIHGLSALASLLPLASSFPKSLQYAQAILSPWLVGAEYDIKNGIKKYLTLHCMLQL